MKPVWIFDVYVDEKASVPSETMCQWHLKIMLLQYIYAFDGPGQRITCLFGKFWSNHKNAVSSPDGALIQIRIGDCGDDKKNDLPGHISEAQHGWNDENNDYL